MSSHRKRSPRIANLLLMLVLPLLVSTSLTAGSGIEAGPEIWVDGPDNVQPGNSRSYPDVSVDEMGRRIHVWNASVQPNSSEIFLRRFNPQGNPLEDPRLVDTATEDDQWMPRVAVGTEQLLVTLPAKKESGQDDLAFRCAGDDLVLLEEVARTLRGGRTHESRQEYSND